MGTNGKPLLLNLGCGFNQFRTHINVDAYGKPDVLWNLNETPYPWPDDTFDGIDCFHVMEHLENWWGAFSECARILKPGGYFQMRVPDESSKTALTYRDHLHVFSEVSFHGIAGYRHGTNAWAEEERESVAFRLQSHMKVPYPQYQWMAKWAPWLLRFCANHMRNFIWEQRFVFIKLYPNETEVGQLRDIR